MNAEAFRQYYGYHFAENRKMWEYYISTLSEEQFTQPVGYSRGSVRDQIYHLVKVDDDWFSGLRGVDFPEPPDPATFRDRASIRACWDKVEQNMRDYLEKLRDDMLFDKPLRGEDKECSPVASASPCGKSRHRSSRTDSQVTKRYGSQDDVSRLHFLCL